MAPIIAALLTNGLQLIANAALAKGKDFIKEKTGVDLNQPQLSEGDLIKLKQYEAEHEEELMKLRIEENKLNLAETELYIGDVKSAREREVKIATSEQAPWYNKAITSALAAFTVLAVFGVFIFMTINSDHSSKDTADLNQARATLDKLITAGAPAEQLSAAKMAIDAAQKSLDEVREQHATQKEIMLYILGVLSAIATQIYSYYFGSSRGSAIKSETLSAIAGGGQVQQGGK